MNNIDRSEQAIGRWMWHNNRLYSDTGAMLIAANFRFPGIGSDKLAKIWQGVKQWRDKMAPRYRGRMDRLRSKMMWPEDYIGTDDTIRGTVQYQDPSNVWHSFTVIANYRDGMSLQEAFDEIRAGAVVLAETSAKARDVIAEYAGYLDIVIEPRLGPLGAPEGKPTEEF